MGSHKSLRRCTNCKSHIARDETTCPFCDTAVTPAQTGRVHAWTQLSAKGTFVAGALLGLTALTGCPAEDDDNDEPDMINVQPLYGAIPTDPDMSTKPDLPTPQPLYGAIPVDLGQRPVDMLTPQPLYGAVPVDLDDKSRDEDMDTDARSDTDQG